MPIYVYRVDGGFHPSCSIEEVIQHETEELGNVLVIHAETLSQVNKLPARYCKWVCSTREAASQYLSEYDKPWRIEEWALSHLICLAEDMFGGKLIYTGISNNLILDKQLGT